MLDAFIIEKIRQDRAKRPGRAQPLHVEVPRPPNPRDDPYANSERTEDRPKRGVAIIDFTI